MQDLIQMEDLILTIIGCGAAIVVVVVIIGVCAALVRSGDISRKEEDNHGRKR